MDLSFSAQESAFAAEVRAWMDANLELPPRFAALADEVEWGRAWQAKLAAGRWVGIHWPEAYGGRGASPVQVAIFNMEYARSRALQPVNRVGINLAGPTLLAHGTEEQKARWLPSILDASEIWCQLFSEPDAGSDLAALKTRATPVDDGWLLSGQKVWTSYAQFARWGICLARTDPDVAKHAGISYLVVDMQAPGIEVRPLVQITGDAEFNEVFFDDVFVPADHLVGRLHDGWAVANTTLAHERGTSFPFKEQVVHEVYLDELYALAHEQGGLDDVEIADALAQSFVELRVLRLHNWRTLSRLTRGLEPGPESSYVKLAWTDMSQHMAEAALAVVGSAAPLWGDASDNADRGRWQKQWLWSKAASIAGGTSEVQRTIIGDRILGLPR
ncbi:MAG TPA: acyl-CoA dehydrogenase family protein [Acidimicrobiia bacterium]|jgi:alkylation response protein AidB-like acyl-CoA dehydrogenase|nr:acyl-CoA dehydrogenase family protein [Acidimicrobiia bacterium]